MNYPDGTAVQIGDHIWWNEGTCVGYVQRIISSRIAIASSVSDSPSIMIGNHPFDTAEDGFLCHDHSSFGEEGIAILSVAEENELNTATIEAKRSSKLDFENHTYSVGAEIKNHRIKNWVFTLIKDGKEAETIRTRVQ